MTYTILKEQVPGNKVFEPCGQTFAGTAAELAAHLAALIAEDPFGHTYSAAPAE